MTIQYTLSCYFRHANGGHVRALQELLVQCEGWTRAVAPQPKLRAPVLSVVEKFVRHPLGVFALFCAAPVKAHLLPVSDVRAFAGVVAEPLQRPPKWISVESRVMLTLDDLFSSFTIETRDITA